MDSGCSAACAGGQLARLNRTERLVVLYDSPSIDLQPLWSADQRMHPLCVLSSPTHTCGSCGAALHTCGIWMGTAGGFALGLGSHRQPLRATTRTSTLPPCVHRLHSHGHDHVRPRRLLVQTRRRARACAAAAVTLTRGNVPRHGQRATWRALVNDNAADAVQADGACRRKDG